MSFKTNLFILLLVLLSVIGVYSQEQDMSWTTKRLKSEVKKGNFKAILKATETGDKTLVSYLQKIASDLEGRKNKNNPAFFAQVGLAKLGEDESIKQILTEIDNDSPAIQSNGMYKLKLVGGKVAFQKFYELLDDTSPRPNSDCINKFKEYNRKNPNKKKNPYCDVVYFSKSVTAMFFLKQMVETPPLETFTGTQKEISIWKKWLKENNCVN